MTSPKIDSSIFIEQLQLEESKYRFDSSHIRPSAVGSSCLRQEVLRILHALYPDEKEYTPSNPEGKDSIKGMARIGDIVEREALERIKEALNAQGKRVFPQYQLPSPQGLRNPDGTIVVAHPDIYVPSLAYDIEIKCVSTGALSRLPIPSHRDQLLLRLLWWKEGKKKKITGVLTYFFRETYYTPGSLAPTRFIFEPVVGGFNIRREEGALVEHVPVETIKQIEERLHYIANCVNQKILPEKTKSPHNFPCFTRGRDFTAQCPWREKCWRQELEEERNPGVTVEAAAEIIQALAAAKQLAKEKEELAKQAKKQVTELQEMLNPFFEEFGDKISAGGYTISRSLVTMPERVTKGYSYYRYNLRKQS